MKRPRRRVTKPAAPAGGLHPDVTAARRRYLDAWRWRRAVEAELKVLELTLTQWLVLESAAQATRQQGDAVSQRMVADLAELDQMTVSQVLRTLERRGLVDRGADAAGPAHRVRLTRSGERTLEAAAARVVVGTRG
jgi:DNA-binding MarR family transcriptional regulator